MFVCMKGLISWQILLVTLLHHLVSCLANVPNSTKHRHNLDRFFLRSLIYRFYAKVFFSIVIIKFLRYFNSNLFEESLVIVCILVYFTEQDLPRKYTRTYVLFRIAFWQPKLLQTRYSVSRQSYRFIILSCSRLLS